MAKTIAPWLINEPDLSTNPPDVERRVMQTRIVAEQTFDGRLGERDHAIQVFEQHNQEVRRVVPPERLLVFQVADRIEVAAEFVDLPSGRGTGGPSTSACPMPPASVGSTSC